MGKITVDNFDALLKQRHLEFLTRDICDQYTSNKEDANELFWLILHIRRIYAKEILNKQIQHLTSEMNFL